MKGDTGKIAKMKDCDGRIKGQTVEQNGGVYGKDIRSEVSRGLKKVEEH